MKNALIKTSLFVGTFVSTLVFAQSTPDLRQQISDLASQISYEARYTQADPQRLYETRDQLQTILNVLRNGGSPGNPDFQVCVQYAYDKYFQNYSSATAMDKANAACRLIRDLEVAKFVYDRAFQNQSSGSAMDTASQNAGSAMIGKLNILQFSERAYEQNMSALSAVTRAASNTASARYDSLSCLQFSYQKRFETMSSASAMDAAFQDCR